MKKEIKHKLKHLSRFCCRPNSQIEFEAVKMAAELERIEFGGMNEFGDYLFGSTHYGNIDASTDLYVEKEGLKRITVMDFIKKLRMTEEEARELEDDRVDLSESKNWHCIDEYKVFKALNGHYFKTNEDGTEVTLHKRESC